MNAYDLLWIAVPVALSMVSILAFELCDRKWGDA